MLTLEVHQATDESARAVLLHPHPDMGGDRHNHVVDAFYRALPPHGITAARFDFSSSDPEAARRDVEEAVAGLGGTPWLIGYSFGAAVATTIADERVAGWILVAPPLGFVGAAAVVVGGDPRPKLVLSPEHDQFTPPARVDEVTDDWVHTTAEPVNGADHFLVGATDGVVERALAWLRASGAGA